MQAAPEEGREAKQNEEEFASLRGCCCCCCCLSMLPFQACCNEKQTFLTHTLTHTHTIASLCTRLFCCYCYCCCCSSWCWWPWLCCRSAKLNRRSPGVYEIKMHSAEKLVFSFLTNFEWFLKASNECQHPTTSRDCCQRRTGQTWNGKKTEKMFSFYASKIWEKL